MATKSRGARIDLANFYPKTLSFLGLRRLPPPVATPDNTAGSPRHPPYGAPVVRSAYRTGPGSERASQETDVAQALRARDGSAQWQDNDAFAFGLDDPVLGEIQGRIVLKNGAIHAEFFADNVHTARLLDAERGRLEAQLAQKGLRVAQITIHRQRPGQPNA